MKDSESTSSSSSTESESESESESELDSNVETNESNKDNAEKNVDTDCDSMTQRSQGNLGMKSPTKQPKHEKLKDSSRNVNKLMKNLRAGVKGIGAKKLAKCLLGFQRQKRIQTRGPRTKCCGCRKEI